ncbi:MAG: DUF3592 domain-containing protein [Candidatus Aminicenantes bacterium]|nr:DUF3592 domain-containing protein [Candidatus Aminicenantes bacterium]
MSLIQTIFVLIIALLFIPIGIISCLSSVSGIFQGIQSLFWPRIQGTIKKAVIEQNKDKSPSQYMAKVFYEYEVRGALYHSHRISFKDSFSSKVEAQKIANRYPLGSKVKVHYHPRKPQFSVLHAGISIEDIGMFVVGGGLLYFGIESLKAFIASF